MLRMLWMLGMLLMLLTVLMLRMLWLCQYMSIAVGTCRRPELMCQLQLRADFRLEWCSLAAVGAWRG